MTASLVRRACQDPAGLLLQDYGGGMAPTRLVVIGHQYLVRAPYRVFIEAAGINVLARRSIVLLVAECRRWQIFTEHPQQRTSRDFRHSAHNAVMC